MGRRVGQMAPGPLVTKAFLLDPESAIIAARGGISSFKCIFVNVNKGYASIYKKGRIHFDTMAHEVNLFCQNYFSYRFINPGVQPH
jgi:hypothetical protein